MTPPEIAEIALGVLFFLIALRVPVAVAMITTGLSGYAYLRGTNATLAFLKVSLFSEFSNYTLSVIPLFILMGEFASRAGMSRSLFEAAHAVMGHRRGGVAIAAIGACAGFGAICGSSLATAATMGRVALPEMKRLHYSNALSVGTLAAGGTLGILIPPSVVLVIYAILTEQNIAKMFVAAIIPGLLAALGYALTIVVYARIFPESAPSCPPVPFKEQWSKLQGVSGVLLIFGLVIGGLYQGWFTPTEGAAVGAFSTGVLAFRRGLRWNDWVQCLLDTASTSGMIFLILLGAALLNAFLGFSGLPLLLSEWIQDSSLNPFSVLSLMLVGYLVLGCFMESLSMILLTVPLFFPIILSLDFGLSPDETAIWFGILAVIVVEIGLITPPVGMNVFVIRALAPEISLSDSFKGVMPFLTADIIRVGLLILFPEIALFLIRF